MSLASLTEERKVKATSAPARAKAKTMPFPIPRVPPVTKAFLACSWFMFLFLFPSTKLRKGIEFGGHGLRPS